jgi:hypothetical protein
MNHSTSQADSQKSHDSNSLEGENRPDFFIVGAAKCGTTSMHHYLNQHPEVFMPRNKEPHYFGKDLRIAPSWCVQSEEQYLRLFESATDQKRIGEASPWYIYSSTAAQEIKAFSPEARILIMLRHPVDLMNSIHLQFINTDDEDLLDFQQALAAEPERREGRSLPPNANFPRSILYRQAARLSDQVSRYLDAFDRSRIQFFLLDDLKTNTAEVFRETCEFLDIDPDFAADLEVRNNSRPLSKVDLWMKRIVYRNRWVRNLAKKNAYQHSQYLSQGDQRDVAHSASHETSRRLVGEAHA